MIFELPTIILLAICVTVPSIMCDGHGKCVQSCGSASSMHLPYPFGFSSGCPIPLNCTASGHMAIHDFQVHSVASDAMLISLPAKCHRPISAIGRLFGPNYAPTARNGILLRNCSSTSMACPLPSTMVQTHFELLDCKSQGNNMSCYSERNNQSRFIDYHNLIGTGCGSLFSAIYAESSTNGSAVSLNVQMVQLGWWLEGNCHCAAKANCTRVISPVDRRPGYRCRCSEGFVGDGYPGGLGCRKASLTCNPAKYLSGRCGGTTRVGVLVGVAAGAFAIFCLGLLCCFVRRRFNQKTKNITKRRISEATGIGIPVIPYKEIERATNGFSDKHRLGKGAYGTVYLGKLHNEWVAVKRFKHRDNTDSIEQVMNEIKLLSSVSHPNLVQLLGLSVDADEQILVYEFMPNGTLSQHLQRERSEGLTWPARLTIATETAQAIAYLHSAVNPPIYHRDIKSSNILLDYNFKTKVADFGLSRLGMTESSHVSTAPQGTPGYLDPQYHQDFHLSDKSDVYSFGVVLTEIITSLKAVDFSRPKNEVILATLAVDRIGKGRLEDILDPSLEPHKDAWVNSSVHRVAELAFRCLASHRDMRPSMVEVAAELEQIKASKWALSEDYITASSEVSSSSSSSNVISEKPLSIAVKKPEFDRRGLSTLQIERGSMGSLNKANDFSPVSLEDSWRGEQNSPHQTV